MSPFLDPFLLFYIKNVFLLGKRVPDWLLSVTFFGYRTFFPIIITTIIGSSSGGRGSGSNSSRIIVRLIEAFS